MAVIPRPGLVGASTGQLGASPGTLREGPAQRGRAVRPGPAGFDFGQLDGHQLVEAPAAVGISGALGSGLPAPEVAS